MEAGLPMLNCLLQHTLRSLCAYSDSSTSTSSKWVYAVFWRILPRNYPPPKWDIGGNALDRSKGHKRNWIIVWEDGFCDFHECERAGSGYVKGRFGADIFFKLSHEVYNYGGGLVGKIAADNSHKWVYKETPNDNDPNFISSWNLSIEPQPRAWESQFNSGVQEKMRTILNEEIKKGIAVNGATNFRKNFKFKIWLHCGLGYGAKSSSSKELELKSALDAERAGNEKRTQELLVQLQSQDEKILDQNATINELKENQNILQSQIQQLLARFGGNTSA